MPQMITFTRGKVYLVLRFILRLCRLVVARCIVMGTWRVGETCFASGAAMREKERSQSSLQRYAPSPNFFPLGLPYWGSQPSVGPQTELLKTEFLIHGVLKSTFTTHNIIRGRTQPFSLHSLLVDCECLERGQGEAAGMQELCGAWLQVTVSRIIFWEKISTFLVRLGIFLHNFTDSILVSHNIALLAWCLSVARPSCLLPRFGKQIVFCWNGQ